MSQIKDPINWLDRLNAAVALLVTPEWPSLKAHRGNPKAGRVECRPVSFSMQTEMRTIAGTRVRVAEGGRQDGPTVLLLSPLPQSILCYDLIWNTLAEHCRLVALDIPGFGRSEGGAEFMSFKAQGEFLEAFIDELDLKQVHIVGPDVGMPTALYYVTHCQHKAASLLIGDGPGIAPSANGSIINKLVESGFWRLVFKITGAHTFVEAGYRLGCLHYRPSAAEVEDYSKSYRGRIDTISSHWFKDYEANIAQVDPYLAQLQLPVQVFWGERDVYLLADNAHRLGERLPKSRVTVFENCGHFAFQDKHEAFAAMVIDWVTGAYTTL